MRREDLDCGPDMSDEELLAADIDVYERVALTFEAAVDQARSYWAAQVDLERRAATEPEAALQIVQQRFRRYQQALRDGTEQEQNGERAELQQALAHYNVLTGRVAPERVA